MASSAGWSPRTRMIVSVVLLAHLLAVVLAPMAVVEPRSELARLLHNAVSPWTQALYIDHGYRFFAPEPGPSHIVEYEIEFADGQTETRRFPDRDRHWPRLLYHRWFMLSETLFQHASLTLDEQAMRNWQTEVESNIRNLVDQGDSRAAEQVDLEFRRQLAEHERIKEELNYLVERIRAVLSRRHDGATIRLKLVTRLIPLPSDVQRGFRLDDPRYTPDELQLRLDGHSVVPVGPESIEPGSSRPDETGIVPGNERP